MTLEFRILGPLEALLDGAPAAVGGPRERALLALLLTRANSAVARDRLIDELWPDDPPPSAVNVLQTYVSRLRKALPPERVVTRPPGYALLVEPDELDLHRFEALAEEGRRALERGDPETASDRLERALALWRGEPLADVGEAGFARIEAARLEELRLAALETRIDVDLALGRHAALVAELEPLVAEHPLRERLRGQLMLALYRSGRQPEALGVYRAGRTALADELGIEPGRALRELETAILRQDPGLDVPASETPTGPAGRSILVACIDERFLAALAATAEPLARQPPGDVLAVRLVGDAAALEPAVEAVNEVRAALAASGVRARAAAFTSSDPASDVARLAADPHVALLLVDAADRIGADGRLDDELVRVLTAVRCDLGALARPGPSPAPDNGPVVVPFGGAEHEWAAAEVGAWMARAEGRRLRFVGTAADERRGRRDASRLLATVALLVQRLVDVETEPALVPAGPDAAERIAEGAAAVVVGLPDDWKERGLGATRGALARRAAARVLLVRGGVRPGGIAPAESLTRFTWTLASQGG